MYSIKYCPSSISSENFTGFWPLNFFSYWKQFDGTPKNCKFNVGTSTSQTHLLTVWGWIWYFFINPCQSASQPDLLRRRTRRSMVKTLSQSCVTTCCCIWPYFKQRNIHVFTNLSVLFCTFSCFSRLALRDTVRYMYML